MNGFTIQDSRFRNGIVILIILTTYFLLPISINAQSVDLLWQGETYAPPFYKGRALWSNQSKITFVAIPQGLGSPASLYYKWTKNGTVLGNVSGVGRNYLYSYDSALSRPQNVEINILSGPKGTVLASASTLVVPIPPALVVYENNPLYGFMFHREIGGTHQLKEKEVTFTAFPFFFSVFDRLNNDIGYEWRTNVGEAQIRNSVTYRTPEDESGVSAIGVRATSKSKILQTADNDFLVQFGQ